MQWYQTSNFKLDSWGFVWEYFAENPTFAAYLDEHRVSRPDIEKELFEVIDRKYHEILKDEFI